MELRRVPANQLASNPKNWRLHPLAQQNDLRGLLSAIGISAAPIAVERPEGLVLIDGHLRSEIVVDETIPVLIEDLTDEEVDKLLTTFDSVSAMETADHEKLHEMLGEISTKSNAGQAMRDKIAPDHCLAASIFPHTCNVAQALLDQPEPDVCSKYKAAVMV